VGSAFPMENCAHSFAGFFGGHGVKRRGFGTTGAGHPIGG
jgi:hypothetical protein